MKRRQGNTSLAGHLLLIALITVVGYGTFSMVWQAIAAQRESKGTGRRADQLAKEQKMLEHEFKQLETPEVVERMAKERLNLKLPGEEVMVVIPQSEQKDQTPSADQSQGIWQRIRASFGPASEPR